MDAKKSTIKKQNIWIYFETISMRLILKEE